MKYWKVLLIVLFIGTANLLPAFSDYLGGDNPKYGGTLRMAHNADPISFNGLVNYWSTGTFLQRQVYNKLMAYDENNNLRPELATSMEVSADNKVFTFKLRDDVYWHDGIKFTSADVVFHYGLMKSPAIWGNTTFKYLEKIEALDDYTVRFTFSKFTKHYFGASQSSQSFILPKHIYEGTDYKTNPANWAPIGTGPFKVKEYVRDQYIIFEANDKYFLGRPYLDKVVVTYYADASAALIALEKGDIDYINMKVGVPASEIPRLQKSDTIDVGGWIRPVSNRITFNFRPEAIAKHPWVADVRVRQAFEYAIDKEGIAEMVFYGFAHPAYSTIPDFMTAWYRSDLDYRKYNPQKANELLDAAGYARGADGMRFSFEMPIYSSYADFAEVIKEELRAVGVGVTLKLIESTTFFQSIESSPTGLTDYAADICNMGVGPDVTQRWSWMYGGTATYPRGNMNHGFYNNSRVNELLDIAYGTFDYNIQYPAIYEIQKTINDEAGWIFLFNQITRVASSKDFVVVCREAYDETMMKTWWKGGVSGPIIKTVIQNQTVIKPGETKYVNVEVMPSWGYGVIGISAIVAVIAVVFAMRKK